jgi:hypothetical protein
MDLASDGSGRPAAPHPVMVVVSSVASAAEYHRNFLLDFFCMFMINPPVGCFPFRTCFWLQTAIKRSFEV